MTQSLLSTSFDRISFVENLQKQTERYIGSSSDNVVKRKAVIGKVFYSSLQKTFEILKSGEDIPKEKYSYRINSNNLANAMTFIQESLQVKPGVVRDANIVGNIFRNLPI